MPYLNAGDIRLHYESHGDGDDALVIVPGLGGHHLSWAPVVPALAERHRVVIVDNRGAGLSDTPPGPYTMEQFTGDLAAALDQIGVGEAHVWGESLGGMIAQQFALRYPDRVRSLVLGCTTPGGPQAHRADDATMRSLFSSSDMTPLEMMEASFRITYSDAFVEANRNLLIQLAIKGTHLQQPPEAREAQASAVRGHDVYDRLPEIAHRTLVIHGTADRLIPHRNGELIAGRIPAAELVLLEGVGHGLKIEARERVERLVLDFLAG